MLTRSPSVVALDVNETLSDMSALVHRFEEVGAPGYLSEVWFTTLLRDGFALTAAGSYEGFSVLAHTVLRRMLEGSSSFQHDAEEAARHVLAGLSELPLHADVRPGLKRLRAEGTRLCALTNGSVENARALLEGGGADAYIEQYVSADEVHRWKPAPEPYHLAAERCGVAPHDVTLAAVHPWDVDGAKRAGLGAVWVNRRAEAYPEHFLPPDETCSGFQALAERLASAPRVSIAEDSG